MKAMRNGGGQLPHLPGICVRHSSVWQRWIGIVGIVFNLVGHRGHRRRYILSSESLALSLFVHLVSTALWIGGLLITMILVWPSARRALEESPALYRLLSRLRKRFYPISNLCLVALIVTGLFQMTASEYYDGFMTFDNTWSQIMLAKHVLIAFMALAGLALQYGVAPALERTSLLLEHGKGNTGTGQEWQALRQREVWLTWANGLLGVAVLGLSAWLGTL
jgi:putative copper export protein